MKSPALFIDRDGTIIKQIDGEYISSINQIEFIENNFSCSFDVAERGIFGDNGYKSSRNKQRNTQP